MSDNVREWVQNCRHETYEGAPATGDDRERRDSTRRSVLGGSLYGKPGYLRTADRFWYTSRFRNDCLGFRLARSGGPRQHALER